MKGAAFRIIFFVLLYLLIAQRNTEGEANIMNIMLALSCKLKKHQSVASPLRPACKPGINEHFKGTPMRSALLTLPLPESEVSCSKLTTCRATTPDEHSRTFPHLLEAFFLPDLLRMCPSTGGFVNFLIQHCVETLCSERIKLGLHLCFDFACKHPLSGKTSAEPALQAQSAPIRHQHPPRKALSECNRL